MKKKNEKKEKIIKVKIDFCFENNNNNETV
jgi:hypothetical protein